MEGKNKTLKSGFGEKAQTLAAHTSTVWTCCWFDNKNCLGKAFKSIQDYHPDDSH